MALARRSLLAGAPALALVATPAAPTDPLVAMEREAERLRRWLASLPEPVNDDEQDQRYAPLDALEVKIIETPATTVAGIAVKIRMFIEFSGMDLDEPFLDRRLLASLIADAENLSS